MWEVEGKKSTNRDCIYLSCLLYLLHLYAAHLTVLGNFNISKLLFSPSFHIRKAHTLKSILDCLWCQNSPWMLVYNLYDLPLQAGNYFCCFTDSHLALKDNASYLWTMIYTWMSLGSILNVMFIEL